VALPWSFCFSPLHLCIGAKIQNYKQNHKALKIQSRSKKQEGMDQRNKAFLEIVFVSTSFGEKRAK
jgi:hypothetical protein